MYDDIPVIHQHPPAARLALDSVGRAPGMFLRFNTHMICQRSQLAVARAVADDEKIGDDRVGT
jgi:hypothetical protein